MRIAIAHCVGFYRNIQTSAKDAKMSGVRSELVLIPRMNNEEEEQKRMKRRLVEFRFISCVSLAVEIGSNVLLPGCVWFCVIFGFRDLGAWINT